MLDVIDAGNMLLEGRTLFPIVDLTGTVCGVVGRSSYLQPKYKSTAKGFVGNILSEEKIIILTEGYIDVLLSQLQKKDNVIGIVGESLTEEAIAYFKAKDKSVILFFDQDDYGKKSAIKTAEKMRIAGIKVYIFETDTAIDMQQYLMQGNTVESIMEIAK